jgi:hypothetical protein
MLEIKNVGIRSFAVALRWARLNNFPYWVRDITPEQSAQIQGVADECGRREALRAVGLYKTK